jgi:hypothetical protein
MSNSTPLDYALSRNTPECSGILLEYITTSKENLYKDITID